MNEDFYCDSVLGGRVPVTIVAESPRVLAFEHIRPTWENHLVVIPKQHIRQLIEVDDLTLLGEIFGIMTDIIRKRGWAETNYKIITNGGSYQSTPHLHFHLVSGKPLDPSNSAQYGELQV